MDEKIIIKIESIENDLVQLKGDIEKGKAKKWFSNPSILISTVALMASLFFSIISLKTQYEEKREASFNEKVSNIEENIEKLIEEEKYFASFLTNENLNDNTKYYNEILWNAKSNLLLDKISKDYNEQTAILIDPNLLLQFGRNLQMTGRNELAKDVFHKALDSSKDYTTKLVAYRFLAQIYAIPSDFQDSVKSRDFRRQDIQTAKNKLHGEFAWQSISRSFELWAIDEFTLLKNYKYGNMLIDSALYYNSLFSDLNNQKQINQERLASMLIFNSNRFSKSLFKENWIAELISDGITGEAKITKNSNGIYLNINFFENMVLTKKYSGNGYFSSNDEMIFDVTKAYLGSSFGNKDLKKDYGVLKFKFNNKSFASGYYFQFGEVVEKIIIY